MVLGLCQNPWSLGKILVCQICPQNSDKNCALSASGGSVTSFVLLQGPGLGCRQKYLGSVQLRGFLTALPGNCGEEDFTGRLETNSVWV